MDFIINDIVWWKVSLSSVINSWVPGVLTFLLGLWFSKTSERRKLKQELKNSILEIFLPVFDAGETITIEMAEEAKNRMRITLNVYKNIYPKLFHNDAFEQLHSLLNEQIFINGEVNTQFMSPEIIQDMIRRL